MRLRLKFKTGDRRIAVCFSEQAQRFPATFRDVQYVKISDGGRLPDYAGQTSILPSFARQVLPTKGTSVNTDIEILPIPVTVVSNPSGGKTISI